MLRIGIGKDVEGDDSGLIRAGWTVLGSSPGSQKIFLFSETSRPALGCLTSLLPNEHHGSLSGVRRLGREVNHSPPFSAQVKKYSILLIPLYGVDKNKLTFCLRLL